jgi:hypothetical protein
MHIKVAIFSIALTLPGALRAQSQNPTTPSQPPATSSVVQKETQQIQQAHQDIKTVRQDIRIDIKAEDSLATQHNEEMKVLAAKEEVAADAVRNDQSLPPEQRRAKLADIRKEYAAQRQESDQQFREASQKIRASIRKENQIIQKDRHEIHVDAKVVRDLDTHYLEAKKAFFAKEEAEMAVVRSDSSLTEAQKRERLAIIGKAYDEHRLEAERSFREEHRKLTAELRKEQDMQEIRAGVKAGKTLAVQQAQALKDLSAKEKAASDAVLDNKTMTPEQRQAKFAEIHKDYSAQREEAIEEFRAAERKIRDDMRPRHIDIRRVRREDRDAHKDRVIQIVIDGRKDQEREEHRAARQVQTAQASQPIYLHQGQTGSRAAGQNQAPQILSAGQPVPQAHRSAVQSVPQIRRNTNSNNPQMRRESR